MARTAIRMMLLVVVAGAVLGGLLPRAKSALAAQYDVVVAPDVREIHCNGDSLRLTVTVTDSANGAPVSGADVQIVMPDAGATATIGGTSDSTVTGQTNRHGVLRARLTPAPGTKTSFRYVVGVAGGPAPHLSVAACPFSGDTGYTVSGDAFQDSNGNGARDRRESPASMQEVEIYALCENAGCVVPVHTDRSDYRGRFRFTGLSEGTDVRCCLSTGEEYTTPTYFLCVPDERAETIVSLNGAPLPAASVQHVTSLDGHPISPSQCAYAGILQSGDNHYSIGLGRRH